MARLYSFQQIRRNAAFQLDRLAFAALLLLAFGFALEVVRPFITLAEWQMTNLEALQVLVGLLWLAARLLNGHWRPLPRWLTLSLVIWLAVLAASTLATSDYPSNVVVFDSRIARGVLIAWIAFDLTATVTCWKLVIQAFALGGIVIYIAGLLDAAKLPAITARLEWMRGIATHVGDVLRISSTLTYPTIAAMSFELTLFPLLAWFLTTKRRWLRVILGLGLLCGMLALVLTYTRGGLIALTGGLVVMVILALDNAHRRLIAVGALALLGSLAVLICLLVVSNPTLALRFISENGESWYRATYQAPDQLTARPGQTLSIPVQLTNTGLHSWVSGGQQPFHLAYHLLHDYTDFRLGILYDGQRANLPSDVAPGQSVTVEISVPTPLNSGDYLIRWDMVEESVTWFSTQNAPTAETHLSLSGEPVTDGEPFNAAPFDDTPNRPRPGRLALWQGALLMVQAHPWLGVGPDNFRRLYGWYASVANWDMNTHANNVYVEWLADTGILGLLTFLWFSWLVLRLALRGLKQPLPTAHWIWQLALIGSLAAWYMHGMVDYFYEFMPTNTAFWLLVGLVSSLYRIDWPRQHLL